MIVFNEVCDLLGINSALYGVFGMYFTVIIVLFVMCPGLLLLSYLVKRIGG